MRVTKTCHHWGYVKPHEGRTEELHWRLRNRGNCAFTPGDDFQFTKSEPWVLDWKISTRCVAEVGTDWTEPDINMDRAKFIDIRRCSATPTPLASRHLIEALLTNIN
jgi:hypothetical protein